MKFLCVLCVLYVLYGSALQAAALDRQAFTFTQYNLEVRVEPEQQRLGVRGKIRLRNDADVPQKNLALQISSTLNWSSVQFDGKPVEFLSQVYVSDIDHTGALTEAVVILPRPVPPKQSIELEVGYEGIVPQNATRLTRIGVPVDVARHSDWDQIGPSFTAVRGIGYVAWYPVATEAASLSEGSSVFEMVARWKEREARTEMITRLSYSRSSSKAPPKLLCTGKEINHSVEQAGNRHLLTADCSFSSIGSAVPAIIIGQYSTLDCPAVSIHYFPDHKSGAEDYALAAEEAAPLIERWFGAHREKPDLKVEVVELPDPNAAPFESGNMLLTPLGGKDATLLLSAIHQLTRVALPSPRAWIYDGLAGYAQLSFLQERIGRGAVVAYLQNHRGALLNSEKEIAAQSGNVASENSLINASDEFYVQAKAMNVWWMLRDLVGETALNAALHSYNSNEDKRADYMQKLIEKQSHRDLEWFFDDWVYRDRGLPDFRIVSVYPRQLVAGGYMVTVMVENSGSATAEVPVTLQMAAGEAFERLVVPGKSNASVRIQAAAMPLEVTVNDGSVPETDTSNNEYKIEPLNH
jgi:hypothetical protein